MPSEPTPETRYLLCYTSGTTGLPKAAKLTHGNLMSATTASMYGGIEANVDDVAISYLPLAHVFEQTLFCMAMMHGVKIGYFDGNVHKIAEDCQALHPTMFPSVPRLYNRIFDTI